MPTALTRDTPLYLQIARHFEEHIVDGRLPAGSRIPATGELARTFAVNAETVHAALGLLSQRGLVERRRAAGTFVRHGTANRTVAVVFGERNFTRLDRSFFNRLLDLLSRELAARGWAHRHLIATEAAVSDRAFSELQREIAQGGVRAVVEFCSNPVIKDWLQTRCPVPVSAFPLWVDQGDLFHRAVERLVEAGRHDVAVLHIPDAAPEAATARQALAAAVRERHPGLRLRLVPCGLEMADAHAAAIALLGGADQPDGLACLDDTIARGAIYAALQLGLGIGRELALVTHANQGVDLFCHVPLTRLEADPARFATKVVDELEARIDGRDPDLTPLRAVLVPGRSCGEAP